MDTSDIMDLALEMSGLANIPGDSGIWVSGKGIRKVLFAIDAGPSEVLLAKEMGCDLLIAHHPVGPARLTFSEVVGRHTEFMTEKGVPEALAREATSELVRRIDVRAHPANYMHEVEFARMAKMPFMNIHLPIDQITRDFLLGAIAKARVESVGGLISELGKIREFRRAKTKIELRMGGNGSRLGNWALVFAAGTNGGYPVAKAYFENGTDTVIYLHIDNEELVRLRKDCRGNLVVLGHMAGDSIGVNIFADALRKSGLKVDTLGVIH